MKLRFAVCNGPQIIASNYVCTKIVVIKQTGDDIFLRSEVLLLLGNYVYLDQLARATEICHHKYGLQLLSFSLVDVIADTRGFHMPDQSKANAAN